MAWQLPVFSFHCHLKHYILVLEEAEVLKLILADDEEMIRESIRALIDWNSIGVEVVASCKMVRKLCRQFSHSIPILL